MSTVWIVNPFDNLPEEGAKPQRYASLARELARRGHGVVWWTSVFSHSRKMRRAAPDGAPLPEAWRSPDGVEMRLVGAPPYRSNVSPARIRNHVVFASNLAGLATSEVEAGRLPPPDVVVASTPPLSSFRAVAGFRDRWGTRIALDIMDSWPEAFETLIPGPGALKRLACAALFAPMRRMAARAMLGADMVSATSEAYLDRARKLGAAKPMAAFPHTCESVSDPVPRPETAPLRLVYVGNMGRFYDLDTLVHAMEILGRRGVAARLDLAGSGPSERHLRRLASGLANVAFHGFLGAGELDSLLRAGDVGIIPILPASSVAIPYKLPDYASRGLAIVECLGGDCGRTVGRHRAGVHYQAGNAVALADAIAALATGKEALMAARGASAAMAREEFLAPAVYARFADWITGQSIGPEN